MSALYTNVNFESSGTTANNLTRISPNNSVKALEVLLPLFQFIVKSSDLSNNYDSGIQDGTVR